MTEVIVPLAHVFVSPEDEDELAGRIRRVAHRQIRGVLPGKRRIDPEGQSGVP